MMDITDKKTNKKISILLVLVASIIVFGGGYFYWSGMLKTPELKNQTDNSGKKSVVQEKIAQEAVKGTLPSIQTNPLEDKPDLNPIDKTNPYKNIKLNPFK